MGALIRVSLFRSKLRGVEEGAAEIGAVGKSGSGREPCALVSAKSRAQIRCTGQSNCRWSYIAVPWFYDARQCQTVGDL
jgi:hypothetical protein